MNLKEKIIEACISEPTMAKACDKVGISFSTFKRRAIELGVYKTNQSGKGISKKNDDIQIYLKNEKPIKSHALKTKLISSSLKTNECEICGISEWNGKIIVLELDHIDGNKFNNNLSNLRILCPNCHSQTPTFRRPKNKS
jgi:hypothetical protein